MTLPAWRPVLPKPDGAMRRGPPSQYHSTELGLYLERMPTEDSATVAAEAFEVP